MISPTPPRRKRTEQSHRADACACGGTIYGMKTTLYLPEELKRAIELESRRRGVSEAEVVRDALREKLLEQQVRPRGGIITGREQIAGKVDELLAEGFGL